MPMGGTRTIATPRLVVEGRKVSREAGELSAEPPVDIRAAASFQEVGKHFQRCLYCLEELLDERENLIREVIFLKEPMHQEICDLRAKLLALYRSKSEAEIECDNYKAEIMCIKRKLFEITKAHMTHKQAVDATRQGLLQMTLEHDAEQSRSQTLSDELAALKNQYREEINLVTRQLENTRNPDNILSLWRSRQTNEFQTLSAEQRQLLEKYYEPKLEKLLSWNKRRTGSLRLAEQEVGSLRGQAWASQHQATILSNHKLLLEQKLLNAQAAWAQDAASYQIQKRELEASAGILKTELGVQIKKNDHIRCMQENIAEELAAYKESLMMCGNLIESPDMVDQKNPNPK
ncbi:syncoilin-like [Rhinoraja longicauda]